NDRRAAGTNAVARRAQARPRRVGKCVWTGDWGTGAAPPGDAGAVANCEGLDSGERELPSRIRGIRGGALASAQGHRADPGGSDWICVARAGRDGTSPSVRGAFNVYKKYAQLDVVEYDGTSYVARRDNPGVCPGDGWQSLSRSGHRGPAGERGAQGRKG